MFTRINYNDLSAKQQEIYNFQKVAALLADYGFNCIKLADDWQGADFLAYHKDSANTLKVQLKSRLTIDKKYIGKEIWMTFPINKYWYLVEHSKLLEKISNNTNWLNTTSWIEKNGYHSDKPSKKLIEELNEYKLEPIIQALVKSQTGMQTVKIIGF